MEQGIVAWARLTMATMITLPIVIDPIRPSPRIAIDTMPH